MIQVSAAKTHHLPQLQEILAHFPQLTHPPLSWEMLLTQEDMILLQGSDTDGCPLGFISAHVILDEMELHLFAVHPNHQRKGIGRALIQGLIEEAHHKKIKSLWLEVRPSNLTALHLYQECGFVYQRVRSNYYRHPQEDAWVLHYAIA